MALSNKGAAKIRAWQKIVSAPYGTHGVRKTTNARRQLALYSSGIGDPLLYEKAPKVEGTCTRCGEPFSQCSGQFACDANITRKAVQQ